jgi:hypothetical protein
LVPDFLASAFDAFSLQLSFRQFETGATLKSAFRFQHETAFAEMFEEPITFLWVLSKTALVTTICMFLCGM